MFSKNDLKDLADHLRTTARDLERKEDKEGVINLKAPTKLGDLPVDPIHQMKKLSRQIEVLGFNTLLVTDLLESYDIQAGPLDVPLDEIPLRIHDAGVLSQVIVKWRLTKGV